MCFPWSFEWDIDLFEAYEMVDCGDSPLAIGNVVRTHELVQAEIRSDPGGRRDPDHDRWRPFALHPGRPRAVGHLGPDRKMGYLQIDAHLDAGVDIGGELQTNCNGLVRATELPEPERRQHGDHRHPRHDQRARVVGRGARPRHPRLSDGDGPASAASTRS